ncbi:MAG: putative TetR family transcriptional regulator [Devosia sp.]|uniref:TetR/AcrR family transcriptional regulator n=1 Tax=Devosia sp. TaxID=1871048 RepID=UPI002618BCDF|nr:TetR/AcrR family transcriptional regulator [Devosia sp.]MDB5527348.1 putative TetR family transcriptional regulator [Devosia sp.]
MSAPETVVEANQAPGTRSERKQAAIVAAAAAVFLDTGYAGASMDEIALRSGVSKQTVYKHFTSKEALFTAVISQMMGAAAATVHHDLPQVENSEELKAYLLDYGKRLLTVALTPGLMQLRRLVIAEAQRFPSLARQLYSGGAGRALEVMATVFESLADKKLLVLDDPLVAAAQLNWLLMGDPVNRVMMLGNDAIPTPAEIKRHVAAAIATFLAAYLHPDQR